MKALVVYYSRTGNTRDIAQTIAREMPCDIEEIYDTQKRSGIIGWLKSGYQANRGKLTILKPIEKDPSDYDLVIIGTPIWAGLPSVPIRTYLVENKDKFQKVAFFATYGSSGFSKTIEAMSEICGMDAVQTMGIKEEDMKKQTCDCKIDPFVRDISN
ncbi:flavodoxin family protein [Methanobacterium alcaliphilum]|uniref:flavodoxin family protein n=1 Tax=Methanobacterium alcaliphilum TaxID=392018 RepID=UPI00200B364A|nr:flavodoxin [Methanobacterium alcaliphilum]MCK9151188.1 flavodoxin [Methanobacterium alcaliphilum]